MLINLFEIFLTGTVTYETTGLMGPFDLCSLINKYNYGDCGFINFK